MYKLWSSVLLIMFWGVAVHSNPFLLWCSQNQIDITQNKYILELWDEAEYISEIDNILSKGQNTVRSKLHRLGEIVSEIQYAEKNEDDISKCFDINVISSDAEETLRKFYRIVKDGSSVLISSYVHEALTLISDCGALEVSCYGIEICCDKVVENFDVNAFEDGIEALDDLGERFLEPMINRIDHDINSINRSLNTCILEHQQKKDEAERRRLERKYRSRRRKINDVTRQVFL